MEHLCGKEADLCLEDCEDCRAIVRQDPRTPWGCAHGYKSSQRCPFCRHAGVMILAETGAGNSPASWYERAWAVLLRLEASGKGFTAEDVVAEVGIPESHSAIGTLFARAHTQGILERVGMKPATRLSSHSRSIAIWQSPKSKEEPERKWLL
jgi:hypothetical protein